MAWAERNYPYMAYFDPNGIPYPHGGFEHLLFAGEKPLSLIQVNTLPTDQEKVGILSYDLKNQFEKLKSSNPALVDCPDAVFFSPTLKIKFKSDKAEIFHSQADEIFAKIKAFRQSQFTAGPVHTSPCSSREEYLQNVRHIKNHILEGDIYEMNYCIAFQGAFQVLDPIQSFQQLRESSPMPFSTFFKAEERYVIGASPERFLKRSGSKIIAQPMKGTIKRGNSPVADFRLRKKLQTSEKEKAENLMIVDLMRNDLSRISETGTVKVEELFGVYSFKQISQMISTVSSTLRESITFEEIIAKTFPMGSMTGAPKIKCMELIDRYENFRRGWFSGAIGYLSEDGDFDFNVVIRSIIIDKSTGKLFFAVGSAITFDAVPAQEFSECMLKAKSIFEVLQRK